MPAIIMYASYNRTMKTATLVPVEEYLTTAYSPDCDYLEGAVVERNVGEFDHSDLQRALCFYVGLRRGQWKVDAYPALRVQVRRERFRVPDICLYGGPRPGPGYLTTPPLVCVEILSRDDRMSEVEEKVEDYLQFGVPYVWVLDPVRRRAYIYTRSGRIEPSDGVLRTGDPVIEIPLSELFPTES